MRSLLDGALVGGCGFFVAWDLAIQPAHQAQFGADFLDHLAPLAMVGACAVLAVPTTVALMVAGTALVLVVRSPAGRGVLLSAAGVVVGTAVLAVAVVTTVRYAGPVPGILAVLAYAGALLGAGLVAPRLARVARPAAGLSRPQVLVGLVPVLVAAATAVVRRVTFGPVDPIGVALLFGGAAVVSIRQAATVVQLRRVLTGYRHQAHTDPLTGLPNRRRLLAEIEVPAGLEASTPPATLILIDLDGFKSINDIRGHDAGDLVLVEVARRLRVALPPDGFAARLGGDEFAVLLPNCPGPGYPAGAAPVAEAVRAALAEPFPFGDTQVYVSASLGLAGRADGDRQEGGGPNQMLVNADVALRFAKQRGKNRVESYAVADALWLRRRNRVEQELRGAAGRGELSLVFQPVMELPAGRPVGVEALLRWQHPELGAVPPDEFIPIAEDVGLVSELDRWVLDQACQQLAEWLAHGYQVWTAVNISVRDLQQPGYVARVLRLLKAYELPPSLLVLEVTEHAVALDPEECSVRLSELRALGVRIALDDFGAGYSSLGQLRTMPVDIVKIDRALLVEPLLDISVQLAQRLGKLVIAEGIADAGSRAAVERTGCPLGQGSALCPPVPAAQVTALLAPTARLPRPRRAQHAGQVDASREMRQS